MKYSEVEKEPVKPARHVILSPEYFSDEWADKPRDDVAVGLRLVSQECADLSRKEAEREAVGFYAELRHAPLPANPEIMLEIRNDTLMVMAAARCMCDPNDISIPYWKFGEEMVRLALTPEGVRRVYDELVILHATCSPARQAADDDEVRRLGEILASAPDLADEERKLVHYLLGRLDTSASSTDDEETE